MAATQAQLDDLTPKGADPDTVHELAAAESSSKHFSWSDILAVVAAVEATGKAINWVLLLKLFQDFSAKNWPAVMQDIIALLGPPQTATP